MKYLDFEKFEIGYKELIPSAANFKLNIGKKICYVTSSNVDKNRGFVFTRFATIHSVVGSQLIFQNGYNSLRIKDILECGIKIEDVNDEHS